MNIDLEIVREELEYDKGRLKIINISDDEIEYRWNGWDIDLCVGEALEISIRHREWLLEQINE